MTIGYILGLLVLIGVVIFLVAFLPSLRATRSNQSDREEKRKDLPHTEKEMMDGPQEEFTEPSPSDPPQAADKRPGESA